MKGLKSKILSENKAQKLNNKKGMTYVELLCALSLLMLIVVTFSPMLLSSYDTLYQAGERTSTVYSEKKEIETGLTFRGTHDDVIDGIEVNFKTFSSVVLIKAKQVLTSMPGLETLYSDTKGKIATPADLSLPDNQDSQIIKLKFASATFTEADVNSGKVFTTHSEPTAATLSGGKMAFQITSAFNTSKDIGSSAEIVKCPNIDTENVEDYYPYVHIQIFNVDITDSPIRVRVYTLDGNNVKYSEMHYYITPADMIFVGDTASADYFTSAGAENGNMVVAGRDFQENSISSGTLNDVKWVSESNDSSIVDGYYVMCGENSVIRRLWHFTPGTLNVGTRTKDFSSLLTNGNHYVYGGDVAYPYKWAGDYSDSYSLSVNSSDSVYSDATHNYSLNGGYLSYGYNGYTVNASSLNNGIWAPSEIAARNRRISYVMTGDEKDAARRFGATEDELADDTNKPYTKYLYRDGYKTEYHERNNWFNTYKHYVNTYTGNLDGKYGCLYEADSRQWYKRKNESNFSVVEGQVGTKAWFEVGDAYNSQRVPVGDTYFQSRNCVPNGTAWGENEVSNTPNDPDIACLVLKAYNNYSRNHLTSNTYQNVNSNPKVNMTSCVALPGNYGETICFGTTQAYALINETSAQDPEFLRPGFVKSYKIESVGNITYAKGYSQLDDQSMDRVVSTLKDFEGDLNPTSEKPRTLAAADTGSPSNGGTAFADTYFTMGYSSNLSAVYDKFINENSSRIEKPLESIYLASKNTTAINDGYHNIWLTREFYNLTESDNYNKSVVAAGYNVAGAARQGYIKAPYAPDSNESTKVAPLVAYHDESGVINVPEPGEAPSGIWSSRSWGKDADDGNFYALTFGLSEDVPFWVQLPISTIAYTEFDRITNDAVLSVYTEGAPTFAPILYYKEPDGSSVRFNSVSVSKLNDSKVGIAAGTSNGKIFILYPDYIEGVISSASIAQTDSSKYQMYDMSGSTENPGFASIDAVKVCTVSVEGTPKFCVFFAGVHKKSGVTVLAAATFNTTTGALEKYQEHNIKDAGKANIKDICVSDGVIYAVGCKADSNNADKNEGVIFSCDVKELVKSTDANQDYGLNWYTPVITYATEFENDSNGELKVKTTGKLPAIKSVAAVKEED